MSVITVPDALSALFAAAGPVEVRTPAGRLLGRFVPEPDPAPPPANDRLGVPPHVRGPNLKLRAALASLKELWASEPQFSTPINDQDLRDARAGEMYGDPI